MRVRIVLRDQSNGLYLRYPDKWVRNAYDALTFANILDAEEFCRTHHIEGLQMIQQSGYFFRSPMWEPKGIEAGRAGHPVLP